MPAAHPKKHLLWRLVVTNLESGCGADTALIGPRMLLYARLTAAAPAGAAEMGGAFRRLACSDRPAESLHVAVGVVAAEIVAAEAVSRDEIVRGAREPRFRGASGESSSAGCRDSGSLYLTCHASISPAQ